MRIGTRSAAFRAAVIFLAVVWTPSVWAEKGAKAYDRMAKAAYRQGRYEDAAAAFEAAYEADARPKYLFNLGKVYQKLGALDRAVVYLERYLEAAPDAKDHDKVERLATLLQTRLTKTRSLVRVTTIPEGAVASLRGTDFSENGVTPLAVWVPFGRIEIAVELEGYATRRRAVVVERLASGPDDPRDVELGLRPGSGDVEEGGPEASEGSAVAAAPAAGGPAAEGSLLPWLVGGAGIALLAGGGVFGVLSSQEIAARDDLVGRSTAGSVKYSEFEEADDAARTRALTANVLIGTGALAVVAGGLLLLLDDGPAVAAANRSGGAALELSWELP